MEEDAAPWIYLNAEQREAAHCLANAFHSAALVKMTKTSHALSNLQQAEDELFDHARDYAGDDWCQAMRDELTDTCLVIRRNAQRAYDVTELYHDGMDRDLLPQMIADIATEYGEPMNEREAAILHAAVRVLIEGGKV